MGPRRDRDPNTVIDLTDKRLPFSLLTLRTVTSNVAVDCMHAKIRDADTEADSDLPRCPSFLLPALSTLMRSVHRLHRSGLTAVSPLAAIAGPRG
jgi:hypothetical protein